MHPKKVFFEGDGIIDIQLADGERQRMRKVVSRSNLKVTGKFPSRKARRMLQWESSLERDALVRHEANPLILNLREQPALIRYSLNGTQYRHYPDLLLQTKSGKVFQEIKPDEKVDEEFIKLRTHLLSQWLPAYGYQYELLVEREIRQEPLLSNAKYLLRHGRMSVNTLERDAVRRYIEKNGLLLWGELDEGTFGQYGKNNVCALIIEGFLSIPLHESIRGQSPIYLSSSYIS